MKKTFIGIIIGGIIFGSIGVGAATLYYSNQVSYTPTDTSWQVSNVDEALNSLYSATADSSSLQELVNIMGEKIIFNNVENKNIESLSCKYNGKDIENTNQLLNEELKKEYIMDCNIGNNNVMLTFILNRFYIYYGGKFYADDLTGGFTTSNAGKATGTYTSSNVISIQSNHNYNCFGIRSVNQIDFTNIETIAANLVTYNSANRYVSLLISPTLPFQDNTDATGSLIHSTGNVRLDTNTFTGNNYFSIILGTNNASGTTIDSLWFELK